MERRFCSKCGMPLDQCICEDGKATGDQVSSFETVFHIQKLDQQPENHSAERPVPASHTATSGKKANGKFEGVTLTQGETVVRQYNNGEVAKGLINFGTGSAVIIVTNKRVISKQEKSYLGGSTNSVEEIALDSIVGVKNYYAVGFSIPRLLGAICLLIIAIAFFSASANSFALDGLYRIIGFAVCALALYTFYKSRQPSYYFSVYANGAGSALDIGTNMKSNFFSKLLNSASYGVVFKYKPTPAAITMMNEIGACIMDLKNKGDYAIEQWKNV